MLARCLMPSLVVAAVALPMGRFARADETDTPRPELRPMMLEIQKSLAALLPLAASDTLGAKGNQAVVEENLKNLVATGSALRSHTSADKTGLKFYGVALDFTTKQAYNRYQRGDYREAQFFTLQTVEACTGCHSALPSSSALAGTKMFGPGADSKLPALERARLLVATRQFDTAMTAYEDLLTSANYSISSVVFLNPFLEYLTVAVRVRGNLVRPLKTLLRIVEKPNLPSAVRHDLTGWTSSLQQLIKPPNPKTPLITEARQTLEEGKRLMEYPYDRAGLIHYLHASGLLQKVLDGRPQDPALIAESYYLLGTTELLTGRSYWLSLADPYFEAAIEADPGSSTARTAFRALEQNLLLNQSVQDTGELPKDDQQRLERLRVLAHKGGAY